MPYRGDELASFLHDIAHLAGDEARKAKLLFLRNGITDFATGNEHARQFGLLQLAFCFIPFLWPILYLQRRLMITSAAATEKKLRNALEIWHADLGDDAATLEAELVQAASNKPGLLPWPLRRRRRALPPAS